MGSQWSINYNSGMKIGKPNALMWSGFPVGLLIIDAFLMSRTPDHRDNSGSLVAKRIEQARAWSV